MTPWMLVDILLHKYILPTIIGLTVIGFIVIGTCVVAIYVPAETAAIAIVAILVFYFGWIIGKKALKQ